MDTPATGMWGPGDYPVDFVTIEEAMEDCPFLEHISMNERWRDWVVIRDNYGVSHRRAAVEAILDLAEDLDARGLVLVPEAQVMAGLRDIGGEIARNFTALGVQIPPDLAALIEAGPIDTADADLETGGE